MQALHAAFVAAAVGLVPAASVAVEMTDAQRAELRERAQALQAKRVQNPAWDGGTTRLNEPHTPPHGDRTATSKKENKRTADRASVLDKAKRTIKDLPGALLRRR